MEIDDPRRTRRCFRKPYPGEKVDLWLRSELSRELVSTTAAARVDELRASGANRLQVRVVKVPIGDMLGARDAVKVEAPELTGDTGDPTVYVRLEFLDLPTI